MSFALVGFAATAAEPKKILVVSTTTGFRHSSIETAEKILDKMSKQSGVFTLDYAQQPPHQPSAPKKPATNAAPEVVEKYQADEAKYKSADAAWQELLKQSLSKLSPENLKNYDAVFFANTTGDLPLPDKQGFLDWIADGHAFLGSYSASDTFHGFRPFIEMLGGEFSNHLAQVGVECLVQNLNHPATRHFGESFCVEQEEIYLMKNYDPSNVHELLTLDKHPNQKKELGHFPIAWTREFGKGKIFYTSLGHRENVWENERYQKHILGGIKWALGLEEADGFRPLFNGKDLTGWKLRNPNGHNSWSVAEGILQNTVNPGEHGTDLVTTDKFSNFTVHYEFMVPDGSNSGFYLRGRHEIQILGDFASGKTSLGGNGAIYNFKAPDQFVSKPGGEWQTAEATIIGNKISVTMNGVKIHENVECNKATGSEIDNQVTEPGPIFLQGDHGTVAFRNIRIKELR